MIQSKQECIARIRVFDDTRQVLEELGNTMKFLRENGFYLEFDAVEEAFNSLTGLYDLARDAVIHLKNDARMTIKEKNCQSCAFSATYNGDMLCEINPSQTNMTWPQDSCVDWKKED
jgi:hypothetical protein